MGHGTTPSPRKSLTRALTVAVVGCAVLLGVLAAVPAQAVAGDATSAATAVSPLAFDLPATTALRSSPKRVFAHYWPPLPVSLDNGDPATDYYQRNYLTTDGEKGKHAAYGGYLRDRPLTRPARGPDWRFEDLQVEVRQAIAGGLDGFAMNIMQLPGDPDANQVATARTMMRAAAAVDPDFEVMLMVDLSGSLRHRTQGELAAFVAELAASPSAFRLADGRLVVSAFKAEAHDAAWWQVFLDTMRDTYGMPVAFVPTFVTYEQPIAPSYAPISHGMGIWGSRNPAWNDATATYPTSPLGRAAAIRALGPLWMQPVSLQDARPMQGAFDEAENTTNLRSTWKIARDSGAEWVQIPTWNDYTENTHLAPTVKHGWNYLDINAYYLTWYKTGRAPDVVRDTVYVTHRTQPHAAAPAYAQTRTMALRGGSPARDTVEALTFLTAPGRVTLTVGGVSTSCDVPAGPATCLAPLRAGTVSAVVSRDGRPVAAVTSPHQVTATPYVQDLQYVVAGSGRQGTDLDTVTVPDPGTVTAPGTDPATPTRLPAPAPPAPPPAAAAAAPSATGPPAQSTAPAQKSARDSAKAKARERRWRKAQRRVLRRGSRGMAVRLVQRRLDVPVSGRYDRRTERAVKRLQARADLRASGVVRRSTWRALRN